MDKEQKNDQSASVKSQNDWTQLEEEFVDHHIGNEPTQSTKKVVKSRSFSTQETLQIAEIRDGVVILKDGSFKAVVKAEAINFELMSLDEQEAIEYAYQSFLNSLYFPIQISIQSRRVDSEAYLKKIQANLKQQNNMLLSVLTEDYLDFIDDLIESTDIMNKNFYVVVPFYNNEFTKEAAANAGKSIFHRLKNFKKKVSPLIIDEKTLDKARKELRYRIQTVLEGLRNCGVHGQPMSTQELIEMYYEYYNPEMGVSQPLGDFEDLSAPFVSKAGDYQHQEKDVAKSRDSGIDQEPFDPEDAKEQKEIDRSSEKSAETPEEDQPTNVMQTAGNASHPAVHSDQSEDKAMKEEKQ